MIHSGLLACFLQDNLRYNSQLKRIECEIVTQAYGYLQDFANQTTEPLKQLLEEFLTQTNTYGLTAVEGHNFDFFKDYALNGQVNYALSQRVPANTPIALTITSSQDNWNALYGAFENSFLQLVLQLPEDQWNNKINFFFKHTTEKWSLAQLQPLHQELQGRPDSLQRFMTSLATSAVHAWIQNNLDERRLLLSNPDLSVPLVLEVNRQLIEELEVSKEAIGQLRWNQAFKPDQNKIALALCDYCGCVNKFV